MCTAASRTSYYLDLIKGSRTGFAAAALRAGLLLPSYLMYLPASMLASFYKQHVRRPYRPNCPVISVGNITAGGTGKTPMVEWIANWLLEHERRPAVLSRGYRAPSGSAENDESRLLAERLPDVPMLVGADRSANARRALRQKEADCFVLDDGFQHYAMARDLDIVLIDCLFPFGGGHLLPRGLLRQPLGALRRADLIVLTRADQIPDAAREKIIERIRRIDPALPIAEAEHEPVELAAQDGSSRSALTLNAARVMLFSGIGNPEGFEKTVKTLGADVAASHRFRDHHHYYKDELTQLARQAELAGCEAVVTTEKDFVKVAQHWSGKVPLLALRVSIRMRSGEEILDQLLTSAVTCCRL